MGAFLFGGNMANNKITIQKLYEEIIPLLTDLAGQKVKLENACKDIEEVKKDINNNIKPSITNMRVKFYTIIGITALFTGGMGSAIGAAIVKMTVGG